LQRVRIGHAQPAHEARLAAQRALDHADLLAAAMHQRRSWPQPGHYARKLGHEGRVVQLVAANLQN